MNPLLPRAFTFSLTACIVLIGADLYWNRGIPDFGTRLRDLNWLFHGATLAIATLGSLAGFREIDESDRTFIRAALTGLLFGLVSIVCAVVAYLVADEWGIAIWLFMGSAAVALSAGFFSNMKPVSSSTGSSKPTR